MPPPRSQPPALSFAISIAPDPSGRFTVQTEPHHGPMQETLDCIVGARRFQASVDRPTVIRCTPSRSYACEVAGVVKNKVTRNGLVELARLGADDLLQASLIVDGYLYAALALAIVSSLEELGHPLARMPDVVVDDSPVPQFRIVHGHWWRDVRHVIHSEDDKDTVRLRGLPTSQPFHAWANDRIRSRFLRQLSLTTGLPRPSRQLGRSAG